MVAPGRASSRLMARGLTDVVEYLVDERVGILRSVEELRPEAGAPNFFHYRATAANTSAFTRLRNFGDSAGASARREVAAGKAIGEAIERYCSAIFDVEELPLVAYRDAPFPCTAPSEFALYSREQYERPGFPWVPFDEEVTVRWTAGLDLATGEPCHLPAARVYMPYNFYVGTGDAPIDQPISTGLACQVGSAEAIRAAIGEVVERDAFLIVWQAMMAPPQIRLETLSASNRDLVERFERTGSTVVMFDITLNHGIPTILSVLFGVSAGAPAMVVAAATSPDPEEAARKSLEELPLTRLYSQYLRSSAPPMIPDPPDYASVHDQGTHLHFWSDHAALPLASFLSASERRVSFEEIPSLATGDAVQDVRAMVERVRSVGERVVVVDLTTPDVGELALGGTRLWRVPQALGYPGIGPAEGDNPAPHPYP